MLTEYFIHIPAVNAPGQFEICLVLTLCSAHCFINWLGDVFVTVHNVMGVPLLFGEQLRRRLVLMFICTLRYVCVYRCGGSVSNTPVFLLPSSRAYSLTAFAYTHVQCFHSICARSVVRCLSSRCLSELLPRAARSSRYVYTF
jgi:hypothetical protein